MKLSFKPLLTVILCALISCVHQQAAEDPAVKSAFARCQAISDDISQIRELNFTKSVTVKVQSKDDFVAYMENEINDQYGNTNEINSYVDALVLLGSLKERVDFASTLKEMMSSQAAAHYDPRHNIYYLLMTDMDPFFVDVISSHELCHALQDQHFDLTALIMDNPEAIKDNGDAALAKQCLAEGDATLVMMWWALSQNMKGSTTSQLSASVSVAVGVQAALDFDTVSDLAKSSAMGADMGMGSMAASMEDLQKFPRFFMESLYTAYIQGAAAVDSVRTRGGWEAVDNLFRNPPTSTEQILHPEKLRGDRDNPTDVRLPALAKNPPAGWTIKEQDVLGELGIKILFSTWHDKSATNAVSPAMAAAGWDGDRYYYLQDKAGSELLVWKSVWDSEKDAGEFESALAANLKLRYPESHKLPASTKHLSGLSDGRRDLLLLSKGRTVLMINAPEGSALERSAVTWLNQ